MMNITLKKAAMGLLALGAYIAPALAQDVNGLWHTAPASYAAAHGLPALQPERFAAFTAGEADIKTFLESSAKDYAGARTIALPRPEGGYRTFRIWATPVMEDALAFKYPDITTYTAEAVENHNITAKIDYSPLFGLHAMVYDGGKSYLIYPYSGKADGAYISYYKNDYTRPLAQRMACDNGEPEAMKEKLVPVTHGGEALNGAVRKKYRLALAADSEYCIAVAGANPTKGAVLAKMVTSINRVNGIYERELSVTLQLIANEDTLIFNTTAPDPYTNGNSIVLLGENQATVNARIGAANYDIGHVFTTGGGGRASLGCVCQNGSKASAETGLANPVGDPFDVDYVAHEMGHQFAGNHTFNANTGSCNGNGVLSTSFEPGSGSTIMAYAGICGSGNDFQTHSDPYFHSKSLEEIVTYITAPNAGATCPVITVSTNTNAVVGAYSATYEIPARTPFELTAPTAVDANADTLTYCWEQHNNGGADFTKSLALTRVAGPLFRSFLPSTSPTRVFPTLPRLLSAFSTPGEKLPDTGRSMTFRVTERDIYQGWGAFNFPTDAITLNVTQTGAPFTVIAPSGGESWTGGSTQTITWDVAGTSAAPISCSKVDILLSIDGGYTYPYVVKAGTSNDGTETVVLPNPPTTSTARIKVKGSGNVFFNIDAGDFSIEHGTVGLAGVALADAIRLSPVPAGAELHVSIPALAGSLAAKLLNTLGQPVWSGALQGESAVNVGGLPRGVYYLQLSGSNLQATRTAVLR